MATESLPGLVSGFADEFNIHRIGVLSLAQILIDVAEDSEFGCGLEINHPWHPVQQIHALADSIRNKVAQIDALVESLRTSALTSA